MMDIVLASNNQGKLTELTKALSVLPVSLVPQRVLNIQDAEETASTFVENALIKARHAANLAGMPAIADDSGLVIPELGGAPGVYSARYSGGDSQDNIAKVLQQLTNKRGVERVAHFYCVLAYLSHPEDPAPIICQGIWSGEILTAVQGDGGFGYDPIFFLPEQGCSAAQLSLTEKNQVSHRGQAVSALVAKLSSVMSMIKEKVDE